MTGPRYFSVRKLWPGDDEPWAVVVGNIPEVSDIAFAFPTWHAAMAFAVRLATTLEAL